MLVLVALSVCHMLNDTIQSLLPAIYPMLKASFALSFSQVGLITFTLMVSASVLQPMIGLQTDRHPLPFSLPFGMASTFCGMLVLSMAGGFAAADRW